MSDQVQIEMIRAAAAFLTGVPALIAAWFTFRTNRSIKRVEKNTDGLTSQLVALKGEAENAKGNLAGRAELKEENKNL